MRLRPSFAPTAAQAELLSGRIAVASGPTRVLLAEDDPEAAALLTAYLREHGFEVVAVTNGADATLEFSNHRFDVIVSDIEIAKRAGVELLRAVRRYDLQVQVILSTRTPSLESVVEAIDHGVFAYLTKPVQLSNLDDLVARAARVTRLGRAEQQAVGIIDDFPTRIMDRAGLDVSFDRALDSLSIVYQPIVSVSERRVFGYEALMRSNDPSLPHPGAMLNAAERLNRLLELGQITRERAVAPFEHAPHDTLLFINIHPAELTDPALFRPSSAVARAAERVVLEITERAALERVESARARIAALREIGFRIAVDDLGAGYSGLSTFAQIEPEFVKLDMTLIRDVHSSRTKQRVIEAVVKLSADLGMIVIVEGVETHQERDILVSLGCDRQQGFLFARPTERFATLPPNTFSR
jgi:EAL domain-containing protein (putative c-di-GMP-specific phosphodiesterase class I)/ActR/RegA family two-component response regulator